jgi:Family of unknown function (DUF6194)
MSPDQIVQTINSKFPSVVAKSSWVETAMFYNPGHALPHGVYFCTIKQHDGENDKASKLDRDGVFRVAVGSAASPTRAGSATLRDGQQRARLLQPTTISRR